MKTGTYKTEDEYRMEEAIRLLVEHLPREASAKKPVLLHSLRVGNYLLHAGCTINVILGGYLHDLLEDSDIIGETIAETCGEQVLAIVQANSKNTSLQGDALLKDMVDRCRAYGEPALLVKAADVIDNYAFYVKLGITEEVERTKKQGQYIVAVIDENGLDNHLVFQALRDCM